MVFLGVHCWIDGPTPNVTKIATDSEDDNVEIIVIPDRRGKFVTEKVPKEISGVSNNSSRRGSAGSSSLFRTTRSSSFDSSSVSQPNSYGSEGVNNNPVFRYASRETLAAHEDHKNSKGLRSTAGAGNNNGGGRIPAWARQVSMSGSGSGGETPPLPTPRKITTSNRAQNHKSAAAAAENLSKSKDIPPPKRQLRDSWVRMDSDDSTKMGSSASSSAGIAASTRNSAKANILREKELSRSMTSLNYSSPPPSPSKTTSILKTFSPSASAFDKDTYFRRFDDTFKGFNSNINNFKSQQPEPFWKGSIPNLYSPPPFSKIPRSFQSTDDFNGGRNFTITKEELKQEKTVKRTSYLDHKNRKKPFESENSSFSFSKVSMNSDAASSIPDFKAKIGQNKAAPTKLEHSSAPGSKIKMTLPSKIWELRSSRENSNELNDDDKNKEGEMTSEESELHPKIHEIRINEIARQVPGTNSGDVSLSNSKDSTENKSQKDIFSISTSSTTTSSVQYTSPTTHLNYFQPQKDKDLQHKIEEASCSRPSSSVSTTASDDATKERKKFCDQLLENDDIILKVPVMSMTSKKSSSPVPSHFMYNNNTTNADNLDRSWSTPTPPPSLYVTPPASQISAAISNEDITFFDEEEEFSLNEDQFKSDDGKVENKNSSFENYYKSITITNSSGPKNKVKGTTSLDSQSSSLSSSLGQNHKKSRRIVGIDIGSTFVKFCELEPATGTKMEDMSRSLITSDGHSLGNYAILHAMSTKSKLIYKWKAASSISSQSHPIELVHLIFQVFLNHCMKEVLNSSMALSAFEPKLQETKTQWNFSCIVPSAFAVDMDQEERGHLPSSVHDHHEQERLPVVEINLKTLREIAYSNALNPSNDEVCLINESTAAAITAYQFLKDIRKPSSSSSSSSAGNLNGTTFLSINIGSTFIHTSGYEIKIQKHEIDELMLRTLSHSQQLEGLEFHFLELLYKIFTKSFTVKYKNRFGPAWIQMLIDFDQMLISFFTTQDEEDNTPAVALGNSNVKPMLFLPVSFYLEYEKCTGKQVSDAIQDNLEEGLIWDQNGAISFNKQLLLDWTQPILNYVVQYIESTTVLQYDKIMLSGGGSYLITKQLQELYPNSVHQISNPEYAVVNGLVNLDKVSITFRSKCHVGITGSSSNIAKDSSSNFIVDIWRGLIVKNQLLRIGKTISKQTFIIDNAFGNSNAFNFVIYKSYDEEDPKISLTMKNLMKSNEFHVDYEKDDRIVEIICKCLNENQIEICAVGKTSGNILYSIVTEL